MGFRIGVITGTQGRHFGEFGTAELLAALESPAEADLVTDMLFRAERRGNLAATLQGIKQQVVFLDEVRAAARRRRASSDSPA